MLFRSIEASKQAAAEDKVNTNFYLTNSRAGLVPEDTYLPALERSHLSIVDPRYQSLDSTQHRFYKPFDADELQKDLDRVSKNQIQLSSEPIFSKGGHQTKTQFGIDRNQIKNYVQGKLGEIAFDKKISNLTEDELQSLEPTAKAFNYDLKIGRAHV